MLTKIIPVALLLIHAHSAQAAPETPYIESARSTDGGKIDLLVIEENKDTKVYLFGCTVNRTKVRYLAKSPVCTQTIVCTRGEDSKVAIVEHSAAKIDLNCSISSADAGCRSQTWQNCAMDKTLPNELDEKCLTDLPGNPKPGCPKVNNSPAAGSNR